MRADFIIVGQGLAGSLLAAALQRRGRSVVVVDDGWRSAASKVAAGLMTPLTGRRFTLTPDYPVLFRAAADTLSAAGALRLSGVYRMFVDEEQRGRGLARAVDASCAPFIESVTNGGGELHPALDDPFGGVLMKGAWADLPGLMSRQREALRRTDSLLEDSFDPDSFGHGSSGVTWRGLAAHGVVFCDGYRAALRGPFKDLGWQPAKGEALTLTSDAPTPPFILNREGWALHLGDGTWRTGTNWEWAALDEVPADAQRDKLLGRFRGFFNRPVRTDVSLHLAGVRPCTADSRPYLGTHPALPHVHLFNGLGPRGTVWGPATSELMAEHLHAGAPIPPDLDLRRALPC